MTPPRALLLDLDGTILDHDTASRTAVLGALRATGLGAPADGGSGNRPGGASEAATGNPAAEHAVALWHEIGDTHYQRYLDGHISFLEQRVARSGDLLASYGITGLTRAELLAWFDGYRRRYEEAWRAYDDVGPLLDAVHDREDPPAVGVVTNGEAPRQAAKLAALGLAALPMFASSAMGARKPDRAIFLAACDALGVASGDAWFVGDNVRVDALGAQEAGLRGIWLNRGSGVFARGRPDQVSTLLEVATLLDE